MEQPICISTRLRHDALAPTGRNAAQFSLLRAVQRRGAPSLNELAEHTELDASTLGRNIRVLERRSLVAIEPGADKRQRLIALTAEGEATVEDAKRHWATVQERLEAQLGAGGREALFETLEKLG